jgi:hypothetical protein
MAIEKQYHESLEDLVFKKRNKEYGSYYLRKRYRRYITISMILGLLLLSVAVAYPLISAYMNKSRMIREKEKTVSADMMAIAKEELPPPPPPPPPPEALVEKVKFTAPVVVEDTFPQSLPRLLRKMSRSRSWMRNPRSSSRRWKLRSSRLLKSSLPTPVARKAA